ncbi:MAG: transposase [Wolbachia endosymbiont of Xenopsylla cheopis]
MPESFKIWKKESSMIAALNNGKIIAPMTFEGHCDTEVFNTWFEQFLTPILQPGQTVILDISINLKKSVLLLRH